MQSLCETFHVTDEVTIRTTVNYTLGTASKAVGKSKTTILRAIRNGRLSYIKKDKSGYHIEASELFRVFPQGNVTVTEQCNDPIRGGTVGVTEFLEVKIKLENALKWLQDKDQQIDDLKKDRDHWREQAQQSTRLLEDKRERKSVFKWF